MNATDIKIRENALNIIKQLSNESKLSAENNIDSKAILDLLNYATMKYAKGEEILTDDEYDELQEQYIRLGGSRITGSIANDNDRFAHKFPQMRGTLDKIYSISETSKVNESRRSLADWISTNQGIIKRSMGEEKVIITPKLDGISVVEEVEDGVYLTRGDTERNLSSDISHVMKYAKIMGNFNKQEFSAIKYEAIISDEDFMLIQSILDQKYKNPRAALSGIVTRNEGSAEIYKHISLFPIEALRKSEKMTIPAFHMDSNLPASLCILNKITEQDLLQYKTYIHNNGHKYTTDGAVIRILDEDICNALGRENNINRYEVAFKFAEEFAYAKVKDVIFELSEMGYITPVLEIYPTVIKGNTITRITLSNKRRFDKLDLRYGDVVKVLYDVIPYALKDSKCTAGRNPIVFTDKCPDCRAPIDINVIHPMCHNPKCDAVMIGRLYNYCEKVGIRNIGYETLKVLYFARFITNIPSIYKLKNHKNDIQNLEGFGILRTNNLCREIGAVTKINDYVLFGSLGILKIGRRTFKKIFSVIPYTEFLSIVKSESKLIKTLESINGIGMETIKGIYSYFSIPENKKELSELLKIVKIIESPISNSDIPSKGKIVFTGFRDKEMEKELISRGYEISSSVSSKTHTVISVLKKDGTPTGTHIEAKKLSIPVLTKEEALQKLT